jgi:hypothetical protein
MRFMNPCPRNLRRMRDSWGSLGLVECVEEYGVELEAAEMDSPEEVGEGAVFC